MWNGEYPVWEVIFAEAKVPSQATEGDDSDCRVAESHPAGLGHAKFQECTSPMVKVAQDCDWSTCNVKAPRWSTKVDSRLETRRAGCWNVWPRNEECEQCNEDRRF